MMYIIATINGEILQTEDDAFDMASTGYPSCDFSQVTDTWLSVTWLRRPELDVFALFKLIAPPV